MDKGVKFVVKGLKGLIKSDKLATILNKIDNVDDTAKEILDDIDVEIRSNACITGGAAEVIKLPDTKFTTKKLQHEFKHAGDFGVTGNWNKATSEAYQKAIKNHIDTATDVYKSTYRGDDVYVYINRNTGVGAYTDMSGNYVGGWKFNSDQMNFHLTNGTKIK